jgi:hypothetical protein
MSGILLSGVILLALGIFGGRVSPSLARHRRLLVILGLAMLVAAMLPRLIEGFREGVRVGQELRR